jgi:hypothetical protein
MASHTTKAIRNHIPKKPLDNAGSQLAFGDPFLGVVRVAKKATAWRFIVSAINVISQKKGILNTDLLPV